MKYHIYCLKLTRKKDNIGSDTLQIVVNCILLLFVVKYYSAGETNVILILSIIFLIVKQIFNGLNLSAEDSTRLVLSLVGTWQPFSRSSCSRVLLDGGVSCTGHIRARRGHGKK